MLVSKTAIITMSGKNIPIYKEKGYSYNKRWEKIEVKVEDLSPAANVDVEVKCDICGKIFTRKWKDRAQNRIPDHDVCKDCKGIWGKMTNMELHGVESPTQLPEVRAKQIQTTRERYGVDNAMQLKEFQEKARDTFAANHNGIRHPMYSQEIKDKIKKTNIERRGVENPMQSKEVQEKAKKTNLEKFGVENAHQHPDVVAKGLKTRFENGNIYASAEQRAICKIIGGVLDYPLYDIALDIALVDDKIDVEYNGGGHDYCVRVGDVSIKDFVDREHRRRRKVINNGWKLVEIYVYRDDDRINFENYHLPEFIEHCKEKFNTTDINYITLDLIKGKTEYFTL